MEKARILEVVNTWPAEVFVQRHITALRNASIPVETISRQMLKPESRSASIGKFSFPASIMPNFDRLSKVNKIFALRYLFHADRTINQKSLKLRDKVLYSFFRSFHPDLIHFHDANLAIRMHWIAQEMGVPYSFSIRGSDVQVLPLTEEHYCQKLEETIENSAGIHTVCNALWDTAIAVTSAKLSNKFHQTIYTTVPLYETPMVNSRPNRDHSPYNFFSTGRFHWRKAYQNLLLAFKELGPQGIDARLSIIGDGPEREALLYWMNMLDVSPRVSLVGKLPFEEFSLVMKMADAYIQSSIAEGFSNAVAEAMAMGLPVFATDVGGTSELIKDRTNGFLLDPIRPDIWWQKLILVKDRQFMESIGRAAWKTAGEFFSPERHASEFRIFYARVLNG